MVKVGVKVLDQLTWATWQRPTQDAKCMKHFAGFPNIRNPFSLEHYFQRKLYWIFSAGILNLYLNWWSRWKVLETGLVINIPAPLQHGRGWHVRDPSWPYDLKQSHYALDPTPSCARCIQCQFYIYHYNDSLDSFFASPNESPVCSLDELCQACKL